MRFYNYLTRKKEEFRPLKKGRVGLYTCGPTVYNHAHVGNFRTYIFEDVLRRALMLEGYRVKQVMNITDVEDKIIRESMKAGKSVSDFTQFYTDGFFSDLKKVNVLPAAVYPTATGHIKEMVKLISILLKKEYAYTASDGVYFSIRKFKSYGKLSRVKARTLKTGTRVLVDEYAKDQVEDFALWKFKKPGEPSWAAPFGEGRPGWHIECSAMAMKHLGPTIDIHAGAVDLLFPHHEDEIAQSEAATGKPFVRYFLEGEHLMVDGRKMSKSLGNFYVLGDVEEKGYHPLDFRYFVLGAHYRQPLNLTWRAMDAAKASRSRMNLAYQRFSRHTGTAALADEASSLKTIPYFEEKFRAALEDDLNAPRALAVLHELVTYANGLLEKNRLSTKAARLVVRLMKKFDSVLGLQLNVQRHEKSLKAPEEVMKLLREREQARKEKNWAEADRLRDEVKKLGFIIEDGPQGPSVLRASF